MPTTSPDGIDYPDTSYTSGFVAALAAMATSIQTAFSKRQIRTFKWADAAARAAQTGMSEGDRGDQADTDKQYRYSGSTWVEAVSELPYGGFAKSGNQTLTSAATYYALAWDVEIADTGTFHDNVTNNTRIVAATAGTYKFDYSIYINPTTGFGTVSGRLNGSGTINYSTQRKTADTNIGTPVQGTFIVALAANDYVEIIAQHSTAGGIAIGGASNLASFALVQKIGS